MNRVAIIGANGQIGSDILKVFASYGDVIPFNQPQIDITDPKSIQRLFRRYQPDLVINTAAFHQVDECESNPERAFAVNVIGAKHVAVETAKRKIPLVHFSTDYVFGGNYARRYPYIEDDRVAPVNVYGVSKVASELMVQAYCQKLFLIRTSGVFGVAGSFVKGSNFVDRLIERASRGETIYMVNDQFFAPTYAQNLAENIQLVVRAKKFGLYHMVSQGSCSWYGLAKEVFRRLKLKGTLIPITTKQQNSVILRPRYSVLRNARLQKEKLDIMRPWRENLRLYLKEKGYLPRNG